MNILDQNNSNVLCRTCAKLIAPPEMHPIFREDRSLNLELIQSLNDFLTITLHINSSDSLPQKICTACCENLKSINLFFEQCENARDSFKKICEEQLEAPEIEFLNVDKVAEFAEPKLEGTEENSSSNDCTSSGCYDYVDHNSNSDLRQIELDDNAKVYEHKIDNSENSVNHSCVVCGTKFNKKRDLDRHILLAKHNPPKQEDKHAKSHDAVKHISQEDIINFKLTTPLLMCPICGKKFNTVGNRNMHIETHAAVNNYKCDSCQKSFKTRFTLRKHIKKTHGIAEYSCEHCNKKYNDEGKYKEHLKVHDDPNSTYECKYCGEPFSEVQNVLDHEKTHSGPKPYTCRICNFTFAQRCILKNHMKIHTGEKSFNCYICNAAFIHRNTYIDHMSTHESNLKFICERCGKNYASRKNLRCHLRIHTDEKPYTCELCNKAYSLKSQLISHNATFHGGPIRAKDVHERVRLIVPPQPVFVEKFDTELPENSSPTTKKLPFVCTVCKMAFKLPLGLSKHFQKMHVEFRAFSCNQCKQSFKRKAALADHIKSIHLKLKPHTCKICSKSFTQSGTLGIHMRSHTGEKPYACTVCDKSFAIQRVLRQHLRTHTGEKAYKCEICNEDFKHYTTLARHVKLKHRNWTTCSVNEVQNIQTDANFLTSSANSDNL